MDRFLRLITPEVQSLVDNARTSEAIYALEETISWSLTQLALIWSNGFTNLAKSEEHLRTAIKLVPGSWAFHVNLAHVLNLACKWPEAKQEALKAVAFSEGRIYEPFYNLGVILVNLGEHEAAISAYHTAMRLSDKNTNLASYNISASLLALGKWEEGWQTYENRFTTFEKIKSIHDRFKVHYKRGDPSKGKKIYVYSEQGVGDLIQFARYLPKLRSHTGAKIILESQIAAAKLMEENFKIEVVPRHDGIWPEVPEIDYAVSICSLPGFFGAGMKPIPNKPYIKAPVRKAPDVLNCDGKLKVGICWAGNADHVNDLKRSIHLKQFAPFFDLKEIQLFSLQKDTGTTRKWFGRVVNLVADVPPCHIIDLSHYLNDYGDTAFYISQMDLVITVDTSIAHLAGAMGVPTWLFVDKHNDWRWGLEGDKTPWYPSIRLFRQEKLFIWDEVFEKMVKELAAFRIRLQGQNQSLSPSCDKTSSRIRRSRKHSP